MFHLNLHRIQAYFLRNFVQYVKCRTLTSSSTPICIAPAVWKRRISQYQFRIPKPIYYPDRKIEMQRTKERSKFGQSTAVAMHREPPQALPKDYYYKLLGVNRHANINQIRTAFYALAKRYHPDSTHSEQKLKHFQELSNAYNILTDENKRLEYDQLGCVMDEQAFLAQTENTKSKNKNINKVKDFEKKQGPTHEELMKLTSTELELPLNFEEATVGCKKRIDLSYLQKCDSCKGKSQLMANRDIGKEICRRCTGTGKITKKTATYTSVLNCPQCKGKRFINRNDCETCDNRGYVVGNVEVMLNVPSGSKNGDTITIDNPNTQQRVNYRLVVPDSDYFERVGNNIRTNKFLTISEAILGSNTKIRGLYEDVEVRIEPGTQSHTQIELKNKGVRSRDGVGNHIVTLIVNIPRNLSVKQRQLVLALAQAEEPVYDCHKMNRQ